HKLDSFIGLM
uniref:Neurokinin-A n=1 Tax=Pelophylax ridibundus TaxID=8406 RepID=TKNB_PELRI|nr:RecName: Full=Neurokinin-A [Pelophylax ridibundus]AAB24145.1 neurokinin A-related peptide [Rana ridibunda=European green frogs, small intestine, Peptide, 10 aa] [Pelophylax ridibundus]